MATLQKTLGHTNNDPPLYEKWYEMERTLPQHNEALPYPEGASGAYLYASNHVWGLGFNNALQEQLFLAHLAYISNRSHVFDAYTWNFNTDEPYADYNGKLIPSRIPLTAFIAGPTAGGPFGPGDRSPRSVSKEYFRKVCPHPTVIRSDEVNDNLGSADASVMMTAWLEKLRGLPRCVEVAESNQVFDYMIFGNAQRVLPFHEEFSRSPILTGFSWSSLVNSAVAENGYLFAETPSFFERILSFLRYSKSSSNVLDSSTPIPGLLAIHIRRGDYDEHCKKLAVWRSTYMGWLQSSSLPDRFQKPPLAGNREAIQGVEDYYLDHCWPSIEQIVAKIVEVRQTEAGKGLKRVYVLTNARSEWVAGLKEKVMQLGGWEGVSSSKDLSLIPEQKYIAQAVDMAIAMRSQVFIGNGFSSLSANVVLVRLSRLFDPMTNRLW
ncbi:hypothetical protein DFH11DRAFT_1499667 [Phellopilus nigrolimitatus]|nr:hypothetical protein DFH11DRAFT_1499667 [Phellopilus nigrolimitatus]